jgi:hypothetical protein
LSDYGDKHQFITEKPTKEIILTTIKDLDWENGFHQVIIVALPGEYMEVGGSLDPSDGLSVLYEEGGKQFVTKEAPKTIEEITAFLLAYLTDGEEWKNKTKWE